MAVGLMASTLYVGLFRIKLPGGVSFYADRAVHSIALWFLIFGFTGVFIRYLSGHSAKMRYMSDSSYFLYLAHMPVIVLLQMAVEPLTWSPVVKVFVVLAAAMAILVPLYHLLVRPTFIGAALNGRRYPIGREARAASANA
jgi:peptidoglycan/LPS O-acetylase OafA/YrhL